MSQHREKWQIELSDLVTDIGELSKLLDLDIKINIGVNQALQQFSLRVPRQFVKRMQSGNPRDPLLLQVLAQANEMQSKPGFASDPLKESDYNPIPGLLHKYYGRVLLILTTSCAINCRYCFRRHFHYSENNINKENWQKILNYLSCDSSIEEIILSGGEPLLVKDKILKKMIKELESISHLKRLRIHTRLPIVIPERITSELIGILNQSQLQTIVVIHSNHANEINEDVKQALRKLKNNNIELFNQAVLLKNINDNAQTQIDLIKSLFSAGVLPYYLHLLDPVQGAAHFYVNEKKALEILQEMQSKLPGYLVPKLVCEKPGGFSKHYIS